MNSQLEAVLKLGGKPVAFINDLGTDMNSTQHTVLDVAPLTAHHQGIMIVSVKIL